MIDHAIVASGHGDVTPWLETLLTERASVVETIVADAPEDGYTYFPPGVVDEVATRLEHGEYTHLIVDGEPHVGQRTDLGERFPSVIVRDRASTVWAVLAARNPVAAARLEVREARLARHATRQRERDGQGQSPSGSSGRLEDLERQCVARRATLDEARTRASARIRRAQRDVDAIVVTVSHIGAATRIDRHSIRGEPPGPSPGRAQTGRLTLEPHDVSVTDTPPVPGLGGLPDWFEAVVPGTVDALERADIVLGHASSAPLVEHLAARFGGTPVTVESADGDSVEERLVATLPVTRLRVAIPSGDAGQAVLSWLYDCATVSDVTYGVRIELEVAVPPRRVGAVRRRLADVGGIIKNEANSS